MIYEIQHRLWLQYLRLKIFFKILILTHPSTLIDIDIKHWNTLLKNHLILSFKSVTIVQTEPFTRTEISLLLLSSPAPSKHKFSPFFYAKSQHTLLTFFSKKNSHGNQKNKRNKQTKGNINSREHKKWFKRNRKKSSSKAKPTFDKNSKVLPTCRGYWKIIKATKHRRWSWKRKPSKCEESSWMPTLIL